MFVDVLQTGISFKLTTSIRLKMKYTIFSTERNRKKLEFENFTYKKKLKNENTQITTWRSTDRRCKGTGKTIEGPFEFPLTHPHYHEANPAKKTAGTNSESNRKQVCTKLGTTESCPTEVN